MAVLYQLNAQKWINCHSERPSSNLKPALQNVYLIANHKILSVAFFAYFFYTFSLAIYLPASEYIFCRCKQLTHASFWNSTHAKGDLINAIGFALPVKTMATLSLTLVDKKTISEQAFKIAKTLLKLCLKNRIKHSIKHWKNRTLKTNQP